MTRAVLLLLSGAISYHDLADGIAHSYNIDAGNKSRRDLLNIIGDRDTAHTLSRQRIHSGIASGKPMQHDLISRNGDVSALLRSQRIYTGGASGLREHEK